MQNFSFGKNFIKICTLLFSCLNLSGCYFIDFFSHSKKSQQSSESFSGTIGGSLGDKAKGADEAALNALYEISTEIAPAVIRPDPDLYARRLLLQYRSEGSTLAREIGSVENYRLLLGGASEDFQKSPQETYDATSLLATYKVAEEVCTALVDPNPAKHPGWDTILPNTPDNWQENISFLAQRFIGKPKSRINEEKISKLKAIMDLDSSDGEYSNASYIPVCAALAIDAESLFL
ncbi:MAG: hypothetical protein R3B45_17770 [Bdellovibrionota bacterium]